MKYHEKVKTALCRYCTPSKEQGRKRCIHCNGWRNPNRRADRRKRKGADATAN